MSTYKLSSSLGVFNIIKSEVGQVLYWLKKDALLHGLILFIAILVTAFAWLSGYDNQISFFSYMYILKFLVPLSLIFAGCGYFFLLLLRREPKPVNRYWEKIKLVYTHRARFMSGFLLLTSISILMSCFSTIKSLIPLVNPFKFDLLFYNMDLWIFGGVEPWQVVHSFIPSPYITHAINFCYNLWFFLMWAMLCWFLMLSPSKLRTRFFVCWILCWTVLGMIFATFLSSAGPTFVTRLENDYHSYDLLIQLLRGQDVWLREQGWGHLYSLGIQDRLWQAYIHEKDMLGSGISAMPSMHVSIAVLMALVMSSFNKIMGFASWLYAGVIFIGSIALGWHYAVDGMLSAPVTYALWHISGTVSCRSCSHSSPVSTLA